MSDTPLTRTRTRIGRPQATPAMKALAAKQYLSNIASNAAKGEAEKARKSLYTDMKAAGVLDFEHTVATDKGNVALTVTVDTPTGSEIDPALLFKLMKCSSDPKALKDFLAICSVTKKAVVDALGTAVATRCERSTAGTENVNVKVKKADPAKS